MYYVTVLDVSDVADPVHAEAMSLLSASERERYEKYMHFSDASLFLFGRYLTRYLIAAFTGIDARSVDIVIDEKTGKPHAKGLSVSFSISHSGRYVAVGISDKSIGVDIQIHDQTDLTIFEPYFTTLERAYAAQSSVHFYKLWTSIEALAKITGIGFNERLQERIPKINGDLTGYQLGAQAYYLQNLYVSDQITCSVAKIENVRIIEENVANIGLNSLSRAGILKFYSTASITSKFV